MKRSLLGVSFVVAAIFSFVLSPQPASAQSTYDCNNQNVIPFVECKALVDLYVATDGDGWTSNANWFAVNNPCKRYGVTCTTNLSSTTNVTQLRLQNNNLVGALPSSIGDFTQLQLLYLQNNTMC